MKKLLVSCFIMVGMLGCDTPPMVTAPIQAIQEIETSYSYKPTGCEGLMYYHDDEGTIHLWIREDEYQIKVTGYESQQRIEGHLFALEDDGDVEFIMQNGCEGDIEHPEDALDDALEDLTAIFGTSALIVGAGALHVKHKAAKTKIKTITTKAKARKVKKAAKKADKKAAKK